MELDPTVAASLPTSAIDFRKFVRASTAVHIGSRERSHRELAKDDGILPAIEARTDEREVDAGFITITPELIVIAGESESLDLKNIPESRERTHAEVTRLFPRHVVRSI